MVAMLLWAAALGWVVEPVTVEQGRLIRVAAPAGSAAVSARLGEVRTVPLFEAPGGGFSGLLPVAVMEKPGRYAVEILDAGGAVLHRREVTVLDGKYPTQNVVIDPKKKEIAPAPGEMEAVAELRRTVTPARLGEDSLALPMASCMTSPFGVKRLHNGTPTGNYHGGLDQRAAIGRPVRAAASGVVRIARPFRIHGGTVGIDHGQGVVTMYLHLSKFAVEEGARVKQGDIVAWSGNTGISNAPHLHWTVNVHGVPVSPLEWVKVTPCAPRTLKKPSARPAGQRTGGR